MDYLFIGYPGAKARAERAAMNDAITAMIVEQYNQIMGDMVSQMGADPGFAIGALGNRVDITYNINLREVVIRGYRSNLVRIPRDITFASGRSARVTFNYYSTSKNHPGNGDFPIRKELYKTLYDALDQVGEINSIDISATRNGNHHDWRHPAGQAMDIDNFNGTRVFDMQDSNMIIRFQQAVERSTYHHQNFGPSYNYLPGHKNHVHFSVNI